MPKLASPVQYESALDRLNTIRPLQLADVNKIVVPCPVLCKNPPNRDNPAVGMFARCTQQGALLKSGNIIADKTYTLQKWLTFEVPCKEFVFPMKVSAVIALFYSESVEATGYWCSSNCVDNYIQLTYDVYTFLPFVGTNIHFRSTEHGEEETYIKAMGFYK